jgi:hypothetical protein
MKMKTKKITVSATVSKNNKLATKKSRGKKAGDPNIGTEIAEQATDHADMDPVPTMVPTTSTPSPAVEPGIAKLDEAVTQMKATDEAAAEVLAKKPGALTEADDPAMIEAAVGKTPDAPKTEPVAAEQAGADLPTDPKAPGGVELKACPLCNGFRIPRRWRFCNSCDRARKAAKAAAKKAAASAAATPAPDVNKPAARNASREEQHARYIDCGPANWDVQ